MSILRYVIDRSGYNCWMGYKITTNNPLTVHHIIKDCDGGKKTLDNVAALTRYAHQDYNQIEIRLPSYYKEIKRMFHYLADNGLEPDVEYYKEMNNILRKVSNIITLSTYFEPKSEIKIITAEKKAEYYYQSGILVPKTRIKQFDIRK